MKKDVIAICMEVYKIWEKCLQDWVHELLEIAGVEYLTSREREDWRDILLELVNKGLLCINNNELCLSGKVVKNGPPVVQAVKELVDKAYINLQKVKK